ncbi:hypothetical protein VOLCADRAFT_79012 [Volvox carteri f. nagariensis]|uniref:Uncharacterized protein n=1 Tax=Volvox carteri f. nagariensis TaxID=3068 RepID=D8TIV2_VOLCA|nr:uncharacterized protein VOLCADRAFT_79012 [Volvox carteri f. nagariensis]EFJ52262.1 hypothetical protein VOLCADRAFT_79012 [Volvox carteri f. nagariensis]|eukprot:XP_002946335.1 hypothetical protein VOLCADRAFT_79012 [Volvox carteri f. nagariensis]
MTVEQNPIAAVGQFFNGALRAAQQHPFAQNASLALKRFQAKHMEQRSEARLPPRIVVLPRHAAVAAIIPGDSTAELVLTNGINNFLNLYNTALIVRLVLTWFPNPPAAIVSPLATVCDPYLNLFRGLIPPLGGTLDFSPILAFVVLNLFTNTAAALPCELRGRTAAAAADTTSSASSMTSLEREAGQWSLISRGEALFRRRVAAQRVAAQAAAGGAQDTVA